MKRSWRCFVERVKGRLKEHSADQGKWGEPRPLTNRPKRRSISIICAQYAYDLEEKRRSVSGALQKCGQDDEMGKWSGIARGTVWKT